MALSVAGTLVWHVVAGAHPAPEYFPSHSHKELNIIQAKEIPQVAIWAHVRQPGEATQKAHESVEHLINNLKAFVQGTTFAADEFDWASEKFHKQIDRLTDLDDHQPFSRMFLFKLGFAQHLFYTMVEATAFLRYYDIQHTPGLVLVGRVIELKLGLLGLYNNQGVPDGQIKGYALKVGGCFETLAAYRLEFQKLGKLPFCMTMLFQKHLDQAYERLEMLQGYIPRRGT
ncbi:hypothetical protein JCM33374_g4731 [Metschnikowia sp. JCM 33374]|nr:hypothetical protein JCM33374_g4731 [Metschnikowia sp. JCM 33374]